MKSFVVLFVIVAFVTLSIGSPQGAKKERTEEEKKQFKEWAMTHKKAYKTLEEELIAMVKQQVERKLKAITPIQNVYSRKFFWLTR
jgi:tyrosyl-tRNA synthetase